MIDRMVRHFHIKHGFPVDRALNDQNGGGLDSDDQLLELAEALMKLSQATRERALGDQLAGDERLYRAMLMVEELGEAIRGLGIKDERELADGLADLAYVVQGTAVVYNIPLDHVIREVHRSNMTKSKRNADVDPRMRNKGDDYSPPDIIKAIRVGRQS